MEPFIADLINNPYACRKNFWRRFIGAVSFGGGIFACKNCKVKTKENIHTLTIVEFEFSQ